MRTTKPLWRSPPALGPSSRLAGERAPKAKRRGGAGYRKGEEMQGGSRGRLPALLFSRDIRPSWSIMLGYGKFSLFEGDDSFQWFSRSSEGDIEYGDDDEGIVD